MTLRRSSQLALGVLVTALFVWLTVRHIEPRDITRGLEQASISGLLFAVLALVAGYACRIERWRSMLLAANPRLRFGDAAGPLLASFAANNVLPFRAGDVMRSFAFNAQLGTTPGVVLATLFVERLLDLLSLLGLLGVALAVFGRNATSAVGISGSLLVIVVAAVSVALLFPSVMTPLARLLATCAARWLPRAGNMIAQEIDRTISTLRELAGAGRMTVAVFWSVAAWIAEGCAFWLTARSLPSLVEPLAGWLALPVGALATLVPSTPGYLGTFDYFTVQAMVVAGNDRSNSAIYALLIHAVVWLPPTLGGGIYLLLRSFHTGSAGYPISRDSAPPGTPPHEK